MKWSRNSAVSDENDKEDLNDILSKVIALINQVSIQKTIWKLNTYGHCRSELVRKLTRFFLSAVIAQIHLICT